MHTPSRAKRHSHTRRPRRTNARALIVCAPAGFGRSFDRIAARMAGIEPPPEASKPIPEVITVGPAIGDE